MQLVNGRFWYSTKIPLILTQFSQRINGFTYQVTKTKHKMTTQLNIESSSGAIKYSRHDFFEPSFFLVQLGHILCDYWKCLLCDFPCFSHILLCLHKSAASPIPYTCFHQDTSLPTLIFKISPLFKVVYIYRY